jgi:DNA-binding NarL/FixJ family response regulator
LSTSDRQIRVAIVENHKLVSESLGLLLDGQPDIEVTGYAGSVNEAAALPPSVSPDVIIVDFHLPDGTGRDAVLSIRQSHPKAKFVFLSRDGSDEAVLAAMQAGASAFVHKSRAALEVIETIRKVAAGQSLIDPSTVSAILNRSRDREAKRESLTARELEVLQLMAAGTSSRKIAAKLGISYTTVRTHIRAIDAKLGAHSKIESVVTARELALVT